MRYIVISGYGKKIRTRKNMLNIVNMDGEEINIAFGDIDSLIIASNGISITSNVVRKLIRHGVDIVFLDGSGRPIGRIYPPFINRTVATRRCQYQAYFDERRWIIIETFIESKFRNQANLIKYYSKSRDRDDSATSVHAKSYPETRDGEPLRAFSHRRSAQPGISSR